MSCYKCKHLTTDCAECEAIFEKEIRRLNPVVTQPLYSQEYVDNIKTQLKALPRYNNINSSYYMEDNELGLWLRYADVMRIINDHM